MTAPLHWEVIAVLGNGDGLVDADGFAARCNHRHASMDDAVLCDYAPASWDEHEVCDLLVREFRTAELDVEPRTGIARGRREQGQFGFQEAA